jgi:hypothetical protein
VNLARFAYDRLRQARSLLSPGLSGLLAAAVCLRLADAAALDPSDLCVFHAQKIEQHQKLPAGLLQAIALVESGHTVVWERGRRPWPWTVRAAGKGWHLPSEDAALGLIRRIQEEGRTSIDVGCMQINLRFHGHAFRSVREALDPASNIAYAASFLQRLMSETGSWQSAAGYYHSRDPKLAARYFEKVVRIWQDTEAPRPGLPAAVERRVLHLTEHHQLQSMVEELRSALAQLHRAFVDLPLGPYDPELRSACRRIQR